jgi:hypothetical protein
MTDPSKPSSSPSPDLPKYPPLVRAAAIIWIAVGAGALLNVVLVVAAAFGEVPGADAATTQVALLKAAVGGLFQAVVGGVFLYEGIETCRGTIPSTVPISVGSLLLALILVGIVFFLPETTREYHPVLLVIPAAGLLVAAVLGLLGGNQYEQWWKVRSRVRAKRPPEVM